MERKLEDKLKKIFSEVFEIKISEINDDSSADNVKKWDSLNHTNLILSLEDEFKISFTADEIIDMLNFKLIKIIVQEKIESKKND
tara:strand:+ start:79 stop:333 length:255 start_codon:yes stop_codon:yes gene_type:complete